MLLKFQYHDASADILRMCCPTDVLAQQCWAQPVPVPSLTYLFACSPARHTQRSSARSRPWESRPARSTSACTSVCMAHRALRTVHVTQGCTHLHSRCSAVSCAWMCMRDYRHVCVPTCNVQWTAHCTKVQRSSLGPMSREAHLVPSAWCPHPAGPSGRSPQRASAHRYPR